MVQFRTDEKTKRPSPTMKPVTASKLNRKVSQRQLNLFSSTINVMSWILILGKLQIPIFRTLQPNLLDSRIDFSYFPGSYWVLGSRGQSMDSYSYAGLDFCSFSKFNQYPFNFFFLTFLRFKEISRHLLQALLKIISDGLHGVWA